jgi:hypothetical protein
MDVRVLLFVRPTAWLASQKASKYASRTGMFVFAFAMGYNPSHKKHKSKSSKFMFLLLCFRFPLKAKNTVAKTNIHPAGCTNKHTKNNSFLQLQNNRNLTHHLDHLINENISTELIYTQ